MLLKIEEDLLDSLRVVKIRIVLFILNHRNSDLKGMIIP